MIKDNNYYVVQWWMVTKLRLPSWAKRDIYAIIYGFTQDWDNEYNGSIQYLMDYTGYSKRHIISILQELCTENLICKQEEFRNWVKFVKYKANLNVLNFTGGEKSSSGGGEIISPNNIELDNTLVDESTNSPKGNDLINQYYQQLIDIYPDKKKIWSNANVIKKVIAKKIEEWATIEWMVKSLKIIWIKNHIDNKWFTFVQKMDNWIKWYNETDDYDNDLQEIIRLHLKRRREWPKYRKDPWEDICEVFGEEDARRAWKEAQKTKLFTF